MIYLGADLQKKLIPLFHYALNPGGGLFLGTSESVGEFQDLFGVLDRKNKLYQRNAEVSSGLRPVMGTSLPSPRPTPMGRSGSGPALRTPAKGQPTLRERTERALLEHSALVGACITDRGEILYLHGRSGHYLEPTPGEPSSSILKMAREGLRQPLGAALSRAVKLNEAVRLPGLRVKTNGDFSRVDLTVRPCPRGPDAAAAPNLYLVVLEGSQKEGTEPGAAHSAESLTAKRS